MPLTAPTALSSGILALFRLAAISVGRGLLLDAAPRHEVSTRR